ncbi:MAG: hypothetical protein ACFFCF_00665 [Promethearchaeota archaeon]
MKKKTALISLLLLVGILCINPILIPVLQLQQPRIGSTNELTPNVPPLPQTQPDWLDVTLDVEYAIDNDAVTITWSGQPRTGAQSPFNPLYNWTKAGYIDGGVWEGNPGNATIYAEAWDNHTTAAEVRDFLNFTMIDYVRYTSYPSLNLFNFTAYENQTIWIFVDSIASHEEFLNNTFYLVNNSTAYLMDGFNATEIIADVLEYHIHLEWFENQPIANVTFTYTIANVIEDQAGTSVFRLGDALGTPNPLNLTGEGLVTVHGPYNRVYLDGTPEWVFENISFPYYPLGVEEYQFSDSNQEFDYTISFQPGSSVLAITREFSTNVLNRGDSLNVKITVVNTGNTYFSTATISDVLAIETGIFQLTSGKASTTVINLQPGENVTLEYSAMALVAGIYEYPGVQALGIDVFFEQTTFQSMSESITINNGLIPSEVTLIGIAVVVVIIIIVILIIYRFRRRIF